MNFNEAIMRKVLLDDMRQIKPLGAKATTEAILLRVNYQKAMKEWGDALNVINEDKEATEEIRSKAIETKAAEESGISDRRMSAEAFEQVVAAALEIGTLRTQLITNPQAKEGEDARMEVEAEEWLQMFAANLVEE